MNAATQIKSGKLWLVVLLFVAAAILLALFADAPFAVCINAHISPPLKHTAAVASRIGDWPAHVAIGIMGAVIAFLARREDWLRIFITMLIACALAGIAARVIKISTGRARPLIKTESLWRGPSLSAKYNAFPSGHTASSSAFFATLFFFRRKIGAPLLLVPLLIAGARVVAGAHYLSDVTFAAALGLACALLAVRLPFKLSAPQSLHHRT